MVMKLMMIRLNCTINTLHIIHVALFPTYSPSICQKLLICFIIRAKKIRQIFMWR